MRRKSVFIAAVLSCLLLVVLSPESRASGGVTVSVDAPADVAEGEDFVVKVSVGGIAVFDACNYDLTYDPQVIRVTEAAAGSIDSTMIPVSMWGFVPSGTQGRLRVIQNVPGIPGVSGSGYLAEIRFHVVGPAGSSSALNLANGILGDRDAQEIPATWVNGLVRVMSRPVAPNQPFNVSPSHQATGTGLTTTLTSSAFSDPNQGDSHAASHWQVRTASGSYSSPVFDSGAVGTGLTRIAIPPGILTYSGGYYWRVRHQDSYGAWSNWSAETLFITRELIMYTLAANSVGNGLTFPSGGVHRYSAGTVVSITAVASPGWSFSHWSGDAAGRANPLSVAMNTHRFVTAYFAQQGITMVGAIKQNPAAYEGRAVKVSGQYRGRESGHGAPPVSRSDWTLQDNTGAMYVTGGQVRLKHPDDIGKPVTVSGTVRLKNGQPYIEAGGQ